MFNNYEPQVKEVIQFLKEIGIKVNNGTVNETLQNHPNWPSMLCITDSLNKWNIPNAVGNLNIEKLDELPTPFLAYTNDRDSPLTIVKKVDFNKVELINADYKKVQDLERIDFLKKWDGIYLLAEPNKKSGEKNYKKAKWKNIGQVTLPIVISIITIVFSLLFLSKKVFTVDNLPLKIIGIYIYYTILLAGVIITSLLLWYEIDKNNPLLNKVCSGIKRGNCEAIITGKASKVFSWLSWSEVGFFYFAGSLIAIVYMPYTITVLAWFNILALPYTVFSVYYQWRIAKQWCVLCLLVQALLIFGAVNFVWFTFMLHAFSITSFIKLIVIFIASPIL